MKKGTLLWMASALAAAWGCSEAPVSAPVPDAAAPDAAPDAAVPREGSSLGLVPDPGMVGDTGVWTLDGAELAPEAWWNADPGVVHLLQPGASVRQTVELPADEMLSMRVVWRGTARGVARSGLRESELVRSSVWTYSTRCIGTLSEPTSLELSVEQTGEGMIEVDRVDVTVLRECWRPYQ